MAKSKKQRIAIFLAQPGGTLVGDGKKFETHWDLCRGLHGLGAEAVTLPFCQPYVEPAQATDPKTGGAYCKELLRRYEDCGTPALRFEAHVPGNKKLLHSSRVPRFASFSSEGLRREVAAYEADGDKAMEQAIIASANCEFKHLVAFSGGRGYQAAQYPWPAYPRDFRKAIIALLVIKWQLRLRQSAQGGITTGFELHPEQDLNSPVLLKLLHDLLAKVDPEAASALAANGDASHETLKGGDAVDHMVYLVEHNLLKMCHAKDGEVRAFHGGGMDGDFSPRWSDSCRRFCTFGTGKADWNKILPIWRKLHDDLPDGFDLVGELECSRFPNMWQGAGLTIENLRRARDGEDLIDGNSTTAHPAEGDDWESFCSGRDTAAQLLELTADEAFEVGRLLERFQA